MYSAFVKQIKYLLLSILPEGQTLVICLDTLLLPEGHILVICLDTLLLPEGHILVICLDTSWLSV
jgi:hypothetical protein